MDIQSARLVAKSLRRKYSESRADLDRKVLEEGKVGILEGAEKAYQDGFLRAVEYAEESVGLVWNGEDYES